MDFVTLKKKLSTYVSAKGYLTNVSDEVLYEVLVAWENWTGSSKEFYRGLGFSQTQMAGIIGKDTLAPANLNRSLLKARQHRLLRRSRRLALALNLCGQMAA